MSVINLDKMVVENNRVDFFFTIKGKIQKYFQSENRLFFYYNYDISEVPNSILAIPFVANVIPLIWITDSKLYIEELDKSFYECLTNIRDAYQEMYPNVKFRGSVIVNNIIDNSYKPEQEAAVLFSGGLDAVTTFVRIRDKKPLLITEYAWHKYDIEESHIWEADEKNALTFAKTYGLENILIQSNSGNFVLVEQIDRDFYKKLGDSWWHGLHHGLAIISASIPVACMLKVKCIYIASSFYKGLKVPCASDPTVDNEIRYASGRVFHDGYELTRQDKVKVVVDYYNSTLKPLSLRVCFKNEENCCSCEKCLRTILGIIAEGENPSNFGFKVSNQISEYIKEFLKENVKYFTKTKIIAWELIKKRMVENSTNILYLDLFDWFIKYDFEFQHRKSLIEYRVTQFFPILKRKIGERLSVAFQKSEYK